MMPWASVVSHGNPIMTSLFCITFICPAEPWECIFGFPLHSAASCVFAFVCTLVYVHASPLGAADWSLESHMMMSSVRNTLCHFSTSCSYRKWLFCYWWEMLRGRLRPAGSWSTWLPNMEHGNRAGSHRVHVVAYSDSMTWAWSSGSAASSMSWLKTLSPADFLMFPVLKQNSVKGLKLAVNGYMHIVMNDWG